MLRIMFLFLVFGLLACSPAERPADKSVVAPESNASETTPEPNMYVEYLWCSNGENYSKEAADARNAMWVDAVNSLGMKDLGASEITPLGWSSENFDRVSILFWENKEARDAGWDAYLKSGIEERLNEAYPDVETCGGEDWANVYPTNSYQIRQVDLSDSFTVGYQFCNFNEGKGPEDLRAFIRGPWADFLARFESENPTMTFGTSVNVPDFDDEAVEVHEGVPDTFDYLWVNLWGDPSQREMGWAAVAEYGQDMMQAANETATCAEEQVWTARRIKTRG